MGRHDRETVVQRYARSECQRFVVTPSSAGSLDITVTAPLFNFDVDVVGPDGWFVAYDSRWVSPLRLALDVRAGASYEIRVIGDWDPPREFELTATMR